VNTREKAEQEYHI